MSDFKMKNIIRKNVENLQPYSSARDEFTDFSKEMIFIDANENPYNTGLNRYPDPHQSDLKKRISILNDVPVCKILLGNGSDEVLDLLFRAFCEPGKNNIITLPPTYGMYGVLANINNVENRKVLLTPDFQINESKILENTDNHTKIIFICSPNNPTGNMINLESIIHLLHKFKGLVVIDEAYIHFTEQKSWISALEKYPNLVIVQTLSKGFGMAGIRLGICFASEKIIAVLKKIKPPYNVNTLTQKTALEKLNNIKKIKDLINSIIRERNFLLKVLVEVNFIQKVYPTEANFILVKVDNADKRYREILAAGIVVRNRSTQPLCENCLRLTVGTEEENEQLIKVLKTL
ncbi:MAG: histidinol-phosphate transaminase [Flavobacteriales bacterium]|nr:MAG: histidinol-phosphate transaminase [Flavobacteriales bacterium]